MPFVEETGTELVVALLLEPDEKGADVDVPLEGVDVLEKAEVAEVEPMKDEDGDTLGTEDEAVTLLADPELGWEVALLAPDVGVADVLAGVELRLPVGEDVELPTGPVTVTVTVTVTVVVEVEGVGVTVMVTGVGVTVMTTGGGVTVTITGGGVTVTVLVTGGGVTVTVKNWPGSVTVVVDMVA